MQGFFFPANKTLKGDIMQNKKSAYQQCHDVLRELQRIAPMATLAHARTQRLGQCPDREAGAERTIKKTCDELGLHYYLQTDPRGGTLYVDNKPIAQDNYNRAVFLA
jgi:hypothetical protein